MHIRCKFHVDFAGSDAGSEPGSASNLRFLGHLTIWRSSEFRKTAGEIQELLLMKRLFTLRPVNKTTNDTGVIDSYGQHTCKMVRKPQNNQPLGVHACIT